MENDIITISGGYEIHPGAAGGYAVVGPLGGVLSTWETEAEAVRTATEIAAQTEEVIEITYPDDEE
jgi:hypothetical protein